MDPKILDDLSQRLASSLPDGFSFLREDMEKNFRALLDNAIGKMNLVSRDEFEIQQQVLGRTRSKLEQLEKLVDTLGKHLEQK